MLVPVNETEALKIAAEPAIHAAAAVPGPAISCRISASLLQPVPQPVAGQFAGARWSGGKRLRQAYFHYVANETVEGLQFHGFRGHENVTQICDMSSDFLSRPFDVSRFGLVYAHAQKNLGPAGVTVVVVHDDLLRRIPDNLPSMLDYRSHVEAGSIYNTAPVFAIYVTMLVTRWLRQEIGGVEAMQLLNAAKAERLYAAIDNSDGFYQGHAAAQDRSLMNVAFRLPTLELEQKFLDLAEIAGYYGLAGHRSLGGVRASLYNAVTLEAVESLCKFMEFFRNCHSEVVA